MNISSEQYYRLMLFLDTAMTLEEMEAFEKELADNPALREQLNFEQSVRDSFVQHKSKEAVPEKDIATSTDYERGNEVAIRKPFSRKWLAIAAAAAVIAALITIVFYNSKNDSPPVIVKENKDSNDVKKKDTVQLAQKKAVDSVRTPDFDGLYKQYFTVDSLPESYPIFLAEALSNYESGDYNEILDLNLNNLPDVRGEDNKQIIMELGHYYKGIAFLKTGNTKEAIVNLNWLEEKSTDKELKVKAEWYLALAYIKIKEKKQAKKLLKKITEGRIHFRLIEEAKKLTKLIEK